MIKNWRIHFFFNQRLALPYVQWLGWGFYGHVLFIYYLSSGDHFVKGWPGQSLGFELLSVRRGRKKDGCTAEQDISCRCWWSVEVMGRGRHAPEMLWVLEGLGKQARATTACDMQNYEAGWWEQNYEAGRGMWTFSHSPSVCGQLWSISPSG